MSKLQTTEKAKELIANAIQSQEAIKIEKFKIYDENEEFVYENLVSDITIEKNEIIFTCLIEANKETFTINFISIFDENNNEICFGEIPKIQKSGETLTSVELSCKIQINNAEKINIQFSQQATATKDETESLTRTVLHLLNQTTKLKLELENIKMKINK